MLLRQLLRMLNTTIIQVKRASEIQGGAAVGVDADAEGVYLGGIEI